MVIVALEVELLLDVVDEDEVGDGESSELSNDIPKSSSVSRLLFEVTVGAVVGSPLDCAQHTPNNAHTSMASLVTWSRNMGTVIVVDLEANRTMVNSWKCTSIYIEEDHQRLK